MKGINKSQGLKLVKIEAQENLEDRLLNVIVNTRIIPNTSQGNFGNL